MLLTEITYSARLRKMADHNYRFRTVGSDAMSIMPPVGRLKAAPLLKAEMIFAHLTAPNIVSTLHTRAHRAYRTCNSPQQSICMPVRTGSSVKPALKSSPCHACP
jgi:hypothetical protein